ncbi:hypothetical protein VHEMI07866 [[Torrubiella] hemipterigena]|uniref:DUF159 domain protein n=1 Tax=[Torrubiella] hemipterigena TaxID=1531966 RepID=A0A0A1TM75_9HYPO|nr:hypothetical protein VHEMI07866 [[Torrubiella] hemipterigena]
MCGRYALALRPSDVRQMLEDDDMPVGESPGDDTGASPRSTYNFAPGYFGLVYRANDSGSQSDAKESTGSTDSLTTGPQDNTRTTSYKMQSMKWGLIPSWTKRNPNYSTMLKTINCRDDSLATPGGMWSSMKAHKRCIVLAQGFFEWLQVGPKSKVPHYVKRKDGRLMCIAGLWDSVQYEGSETKTFTYTIITTDSNKQLKFLHSRMPVILEPNSDALWTWLDPRRRIWSKELQTTLKPFSGELEVYPVHQDVGKVGNNSPAFVRPLDDARNKSNIVHFFKSKPLDNIKPDESKKRAVATETGDFDEIRKKPRLSTGTGGANFQKLGGNLTGNLAFETNCKGKITGFFDKKT